MILTSTGKQFYTPEEYLELEEKAEFRNEYRNGEIVPMTGGTTNHNQIALNFCRRFPLTIQGQDYTFYINDVRLWIPDKRTYTYPDVMIIEGKPIYYGKGTTTVTNPLVVIEVLSQSTQEYDRSDKFRSYRSIPTFQEYIRIDQYSFFVEQYTKQSDHQWLMTEYTEENTILNLSSIDFQIAFTDLYQRVEFEAVEAE